MGEDTASGPASGLVPDRVLSHRYRLTEQLAVRGTTVTWRAIDTALSRPVLVHLLAPDQPTTPQVLHAAKQAASATDSRFLRVLDAVHGEGDDPSFVVAEFAPGESLTELLGQGPLSALEAAWVVREVADAMQVMHSAGLFHLQLNPDTIVITATGNVKIVGLLIEAALNPDPAHTRLNWAEREHLDVVAMGKLLYACLVSRWPTSHRTDPTWGMAAAPADAEGWLTPRQVRAGVSPALDVICDQVLSPVPRHHEPPIRSCSELVTSLSRVLGTADASADLERRMRFPITAISQQTGRPDPDQTHRREALDATIGIPAVSVAASDWPTITQDVVPGPYPQGWDDSEPVGPGPAVADPAPPVTGSRPRPRPRTNRRWLTLLVGLVVLVMAGSLIATVVRNGSQQARRGGDGASASATPAVYPISGADDFDPTADGGNAEENPDQLALARDGNPQTAWTTLTYRGNPKLGGLKPGVGIVLDLGSAKPIGAVDLTLVGGSTSVQVMVPATSPEQATQAPMDSVKAWRTVSANAAATGTVSLVPTGPVTSRFVLVYLTQLPQVRTGRYQGGIAEVRVTS